MKTRKIGPLYIVFLVAALWAAAMSPYAGKMLAQTNQSFLAPTIYTAGTAVAGWTGGNINNGGHPVVVAAGTGSVTTSKNDCSAPNYANCNFVVANSSGTVSVTTSPVTAMAAGNTLLAYVETNGTTITGITQPLQSSVGTTFFAPAFSCGNALAANGACANTGLGGNFHVITGSAVLGSNTSTITGIAPAFTSSTSWWCVANDITTRANPVQAIPASSSTLTITNTTGATDTIQYACFGN